MWLFPSCYFHPLEQRGPAFHSCWHSKLGFLPPGNKGLLHLHGPPTPGSQAKFQTLHPQGTLGTSARGQRHTVALLLWRALNSPESIMNLHPSYILQQMSVCALTFLEKAASLSLSFLFLKEQQLIFPCLSQSHISHSAPFSWESLFILILPLPCKDLMSLKCLLSCRPRYINPYQAFLLGFSFPSLPHPYCRFSMTQVQLMLHTSKLIPVWLLCEWYWLTSFSNLRAPKILISSLPPVSNWSPIFIDFT